MKAKLTVSIDEALIPQAKTYARSQGLSLSQLIENTLRVVSVPHEKSFSERWRGKFELSEKNDERSLGLRQRYS